jgi:SAM-dependent methyltransferase
VIGYVWRRFLAERVARSVHERTRAALDERIHVALTQVVAASRQQLLSAVESLRAELRETVKAPPSETTAAIAQSVSEHLDRLRQRIYLPAPEISPATDGPYMAYSTCSAADIRHRHLSEFTEAVRIPRVFHRKMWEWAFITHHLQRLGAIGPGKRGLVFGVGAEPLPSLFAKEGAQIVATDGPPEVSERGWLSTNQFADSAGRLWREEIIDRENFMSQVSYETCDMTRIPSHLTDFDFCWSSCCFEHLGSLEAGAEFVLNSVERTLKPGGVAVHTTEFNLTSDSDTIADGPTVLYRRRDLEALILRLRKRGHEVDDLQIAPDVDPLDFFVDMPPYHGPHLKLKLMGYTTTSVGLVIRRGLRS